MERYCSIFPLALNSYTIMALHFARPVDILFLMRGSPQSPNAIRDETSHTTATKVARVRFHPCSRIDRAFIVPLCLVKLPAHKLRLWDIPKSQCFWLLRSWRNRFYPRARLREGQTVTIDLTDYPLPPVEQILGFLVWMVQNG